MTDKAASVLAKLKNKAQKENIPYQQILNLFCQEEFLRRLSKSSYRDKLILKGGFLLYSMSGFSARPTVDADYLLKNYPNDLPNAEKLINDIISLFDENNLIHFEIRKLEIISEMKTYHGIRVYLAGSIARTKTPFSIDIGFGDVIVPAPVQRTIPALLAEFEMPFILTYSLESTVAEKLDAIISLMEATGRMKDFYDIYYLATTFDFDGKILQKAAYETFANRKTPIEKDSVAVIARLIKDTLIQKRWVNFCRKVLGYDLDFGVVVIRMIEFLSPPFEAMIDKAEFTKIWRGAEGQYF
ncbi:MAG: nucleotidyl transferase AbiEii/AbiGii toxin family protein [Clostridiales bacterium]|nr:nucleotidyl transferase AbiEii/AbiGii toxin family protein [Clostridiales bacterium]